MNHLKPFSRVQTVEFAPSLRNHRHVTEPANTRDHPVQEEVRSRQSPSVHTRASLIGRTHGTHPIMHLHRERMNRDMGGFPMPWTIIGSLFTKVFPGLKRKFRRTLTVPVTMSLTPGHENKPGSKYAPYLSFEARVGPNSNFHLLTSDQLDEIGGVEYRALNALLCIVAGVNHVSLAFTAYSMLTLCSTTSVFSWWHSLLSHRISPRIDGSPYFRHLFISTLPGEVIEIFIHEATESDSVLND